MTANEPERGLAEALQSIRHLSTIRFLGLPVFFTASGVLAHAYFGDPSGYAQRDLIPLTGLIVALVFAVVEIVLSRNMIRQWKGAATLAPPELWKALAAHRDPVVLWTVRLVLFLPYAAAAQFWVLHARLDPALDPASLVARFALLAGLYAIAIVVWYRAEREPLA